MKEDKDKKKSTKTKSVSSKNTKNNSEIGNTGRSKRLGPVIPRLGFKPKSLGGGRYGCGGKLK